MISIKVAERPTPGAWAGQPSTAAHIVLDHWADMAGSDQEMFVAIGLNGQNKVVATWLVAMGGHASSTVDMRCLMTRALLEKCSQLIVAHNHPGGTGEPSPEDIELTKQIAEACKVLGMKLVDHLILYINEEGQTGWVSFHERGLLK